MEQQQKFYPVGIQTFSEIIGKNYLYIAWRILLPNICFWVVRVVLASRCWPVRFIVILRGGKNCSKDLLSKSWRRNGICIRFFTLTWVQRSTWIKNGWTVNWKENFWNMKKYMGEVKVMLKLTNACRGWYNALFSRPASKLLSWLTNMMLRFLM